VISKHLACGSFLASKNNPVSSHPCLCTYRVRMIGIQH
jgi:hypothetical protein